MQPVNISYLCGAYIVKVLYSEACTKHGRKIADIGIGHASIEEVPMHEPKDISTSLC